MVKKRENMLTAGKNGSGTEVDFYNKFVYYGWGNGDTKRSDLGKQLDKNCWIKEHVNDESGITAVSNMLEDWDLFENGWIVTSNGPLFNYLCQLGNTSRPEELVFLITKRKRVPDDFGIGWSPGWSWNGTRWIWNGFGEHKKTPMPLSRPPPEFWAK